MGGYGSTRWAGHDKARTVEDTLVLDVADLTRKDLLSKDPSFVSRTLRWTFVRSGEERGSIGFVVDTRDERDPWVRLHYQTNGTPQDYRVHLTSTRPPFGGLRWWWRCPALGCGRRSMKLYLTSSSGVFACRKCHRLTYTSAQEHDARVDRLVRGGLKTLLLKGPPGESLKTSLLLLKAQTKILGKMERRETR